MTDRRTVGMEWTREMDLEDFHHQEAHEIQSSGTDAKAIDDSAFNTDIAHNPDKDLPRRSERQRAPNTQIDFSEFARQQSVREQKSLAATWSKACYDIEAEIEYVRTDVEAASDNTDVGELLKLLESLWKSLEHIHCQYLPGIKEQRRQQEVEERFLSIKEKVSNIRQECQIRKCRAQQDDDNVSVFSLRSSRSHNSSSSKASFTSSQKERLKAALLAKKKLELARARAAEEAEEHRRRADEETRRKLRNLEEAAALTELEWKIEAEYDEETGVLRSVEHNAGLDTTCTQKCITPLDALTKGCFPKGSTHTIPAAKPPTAIKPKIEYRDLPPHTTGYNDAVCEDFQGRRIGSGRTQLNYPVSRPGSIVKGTFRLGEESDEEDDDKAETVQDHLAAMWKVQLLNGMTPIKFSGNPAEFPFFRKKVRAHLETELLSDSQRVEYLPKFLRGEALDVVERNRGCSYKVLIQTLQDRFGRPAQIAQACIDDLVSGPKLTPGDNTGLLNFAEKLNTATKVLKGEDEQEISVATNLKRVVHRLPNDLIAKWQNENYRIVSDGATARLKDIARFVKKQATIRNDPVFGNPARDAKDTKNAARSTKIQGPTHKQATLAAASVDAQPDYDNTRMNACQICKGVPHKFQQCPVIKGCDRVAVRRQYAASYGFCFNCGANRPGHGSFTCPEPAACTRCSGTHMELLHRDYQQRGRRFSPKNPDHPVTEGVPGRRDVTTSNSNAHTANDGTASAGAQPANKKQAVVASVGLSTMTTPVLLNVIPVIITAENGNAISTYAFLDNGCTDTLIDRSLADELGIKGNEEDIQISTITERNLLTKSQRVQFTLTAADGYGEDIEVKEAYVLPDLNQTERVLPDSIDLTQHPHLQDLQFPEVTLRRVSILVGSNLPGAHVQREVRLPQEGMSGLFGYRYPLGWSLSGPLGVKSHRKASINFISVDCQLNDQVEKFWAVEDYGATKANDKPLSVEDQRAMKIIKDTTRLIDGHYEVGLLWREDQPSLPNNRTMAERRLQSLRGRLSRPGNEILAAKYREVLSGYIARGYARKLSLEEVKKESSICWYLPHHPVTSPNKPGKVRIVFDAAAEFEGESLNKNLLQGPDMTNNLVGVLVRFRQGNVAVAADVEAMFHQVRVRRCDQDALRFLWWTNNYDDPPDVYVMQAHIFGAASSPCVANSVLRRTATDNVEDFDKEVVSAVKRNFYVDDGLPSAEDSPSAIRLASGMMDLLTRGGFRLTKFMSNSKEVLSAIPTERRAAPELNLDLDELPVERALGVRWFVETDELGFQIRELNRPDTKRGILSTVCSLYDPLGFAAPVTLSARNLIQELWKAKVDWDQPLEEKLLGRWKQWKGQLDSLSKIRIPRSYFLSETVVSQCQLQIHHFADASEVGYGTSSYLRIEYPDGTIHCAFVMGKSRNAPVKFTSIPRLELQAAVLATRMNKMLREELDLRISRTIYWTDSEIVLHYLKNERRRFQTYVANRVEEIKENSLVEEWNHVPGALNPADDASRGLHPCDLNLNHRWLRGPEFLWQAESSWPNAALGHVQDEMLEVRKESRIHCVNLATAAGKGEHHEDSRTTDKTPCVDKIEQMLNDCSDWVRLNRKIAWLIRFTQYIRDNNNMRTGGLTPDDCHAATLAISRIMQKSAYESEISDLKAGRPIMATSKILNLNPVIDDDGLLRVNGRIKNAPIPYSAKYPIILPRDHHTTSVLAYHMHASMGHLGREHVLAKLREQFWIPRARVLVRSVLGRCLTCKKMNSRPMTQQMAPLPVDRVTAYEPPFSRTGMDLFGPLYVKHGKSTAKRWCCLFTCLNTRAIHLELVDSLSTDDFLLCLRRFMNRRGEVVELRCDNGSNFVGGERETREAVEQWNQEQLQRELTQRGCKWVFQPPTASSMSGVWERLVRSAKTVLKAILGAHMVTHTVLQTLLTEVEKILNGRALTANSDDPNDLEPLTPAHFLVQRRVVSLPPGVFDKADMYLRKKWKQVQYLADLFWRRWLKEYLPTLQARSKWLRAKQNLKPNALVLLVDDSIPRGVWKLGRVLEIFPGQDGIVRTAKVKTKDSTYVRPIQKLCLLEDDLFQGTDSK